MKDVLIEIGLEEMPARFINDAQKQLKEQAESWLKEERIDFKEIVSYQSPRRLAVLIKEVSEEQETIEEEVRGPAAKIAKDEAGNWSKAAIGFSKGQGLSVDDLYMKDVKGVEYVFGKKLVEGRPTIEVLPGFKEIITHLQFGKNMRWGNETMRYVRPIRWIVALFGQEVIPFEIAHVKTSNQTQGHRFLGSSAVITNPADYESVLKEQFVIPVYEERKDKILEQIREIERENGFQVPVDEELLQEVTNLVEYPTAFVGDFPDAFLEIPDEVLITSMKEHQRYFPVKSSEGNLLPHFVAVRNGDHAYIDIVKKGNEKVLNARLSDARFFYEEDKKESIDFYMDKLKRVVFQAKLGTYDDKAKRISDLAVKVAQMAGVDETVQKQAERAAYICKFDLVTNMVGEFTELEGIMGEKYALHFGEEPAIAQAIREHYMPVQANGELPKSAAGAIVAVADKLDTITGTILSGLMPSGSQDPYGLRRQAAGVMRILEKENWDVTVESLLKAARDVFANSAHQVSITDSAIEDVSKFFRQRAEYLLKEKNVDGDIIQAVAKDAIGNFPYAIRKAEVLVKKRQDSAFKPVEEALVRVLNIAKEDPKTEVDPHYFATDSEKALYDQLQRTKIAFEEHSRNKEAVQALDDLAGLSSFIDDFFDHNMVMADDPKLKSNRLALLWNIAVLIRNYADLSAIEWKQHF